MATVIKIQQLNSGGKFTINQSIVNITVVLKRFRDKY